jgi:hypothetical protein
MHRIQCPKCLALASGRLAGAPDGRRDARRPRSNGCARHVLGPLTSSASSSFSTPSLFCLNRLVRVGWVNADAIFNELGLSALMRRPCLIPSNEAPVSVRRGVVEGVGLRWCDGFVRGHKGRERLGGHLLRTGTRGLERGLPSAHCYPADPLLFPVAPFATSNGKIALYPRLF